MGDRVTTPIRDPDFISILLATRGRPHFLARLFDSIVATASAPERLDVWLYADADDEPTLAFVRDEAPKRYPFGVHAVCGPRTLTNGEMYNALRAANTSGAGLFMFSSDKIAFKTQGWDDVVRQAYAQFPDRILFAFVRDSVNNGQFGAFGFLSAEWANTTGRVMTEYFPYWFDDTWINHVAAFVGRIWVVDVEVEIEQARTGRMQNLCFWQRFYHALREERIAEAEALREVIRERGGESLYAASLEIAAETIRLARDQEKYSAETQAAIVQIERNASAAFRSLHPRAAADSDARKAEDQAVQRLNDWLLDCINMEDMASLALTLDALAFCSRAADDLLAKARAALAAGQLPPDHEFLRMLAWRFANVPETYLVTADAWTASGQPQKALEVLTEAGKIFPASLDIAKGLAVALYQVGELEGAADAFEAIIELAPDDLDTLVSLAQLWLQAGNPLRALELYQRAESLSPDDADVRAGLYHLRDVAARAVGPSEG